MSRNKLKKFAEARELENVFVLPEEGWKKEFSGKEIVLEIGCGYGDYALILAEKFPDKFFIGVDRKLERLWGGAQEAIKAGIKNVAFVWAEVLDLAQWFDKDEVSEIWITFPDPFLKPCKEGKRLTSSKSLEIYRRILYKDGVINLKTDNEALFDFSLESFEREHGRILQVSRDVHNEHASDDLLSITTYYEKQYIAEGKPIFYSKSRI